MDTIYLDNAATTKPYDDITSLMKSIMDVTYANPSSSHDDGQNANIILSNARGMVFESLHANAYGRVVFTSGGTESDNLAIIGGALSIRRKSKNKRNHIVTTAIEHDAVLNACRCLEQHYGFDVTYLPVDQNGIVSMPHLQKAVTSRTALVSVMAVNNEVGTKQPIREIADAAHAKGAMFHTDAVQAIGWSRIDAIQDHLDMVSFSAHKFHGPKGVGGLYISPEFNDGCLPNPIIFGGGQEYGLRSGTQNVPAIGGMAVAMRRACEDIPERLYTTQKRRERFISVVMQGVPDTVVNCNTSYAVPNIISLAFPNVDAELLMYRLSKLGVMVSNGSACHAASIEPSHVLKAIGLDDSLIHSTIRVSLSEDTTVEQLFPAASKICKVVNSLREIA